ncbi:EcoKI restriction-modification system protein HsdS [Turicibacter sanguinis]|nr:EcoKI restriction-modification system protein HsdS [Turicibacter sanguinis]
MIKKVKLGDLVQIDSGYAFKSNLFNEDNNGVPLIRIRDISSGACNTFYSGEYDDKYLVNNGDLLIGMDGSFQLRNWQAGTALLNQRVCRIKSMNSLLEDKYLEFILPLHLKKIEDKTPFVTVKHLSVKDIQNIELILPPVNQQMKIASILDQAQELIDKRKAQIEALDELKKSIYQQMFLAIHWEKNKLEEIIKEKGAIKCGPFGSQLLISEFTDEGIPVLGIENVGENKFVYTDNKYISEEKYTQLNAFKVQPGDVLISRTGTVGRTCVVPDEFSLGIIGPNLLKITPNTQIITSNYLASTFNYSRDVVNQVKLNSPGATVAVFNTGNLKKVSIPVPPIELQNKFAEIVESIEKQKELLNKSLVELENNFNSLMQRAFKGELF